MNKRTLLGLSAILFVGIITLTCSYCVMSHLGLGLDDQDGPMLRADGDPLPPFPPQGLSSPSDLRADGDPLPPFPPQGLSSPSDARMS